jgi:hypothetical protein
VKVAGRKKAPLPKLSAEDALAALRWLHATGVVTAKQIAGALRKREELVEEIRQRLEALGGHGARFLTGVAALKRPPAAIRRRRKISVRAQAVWRAQGRYMAAVRRLSKANRAKVKRIREAKGVAEAIAAARRMGKPSTAPG